MLYLTKKFIDLVKLIFFLDVAVVEIACNCPKDQSGTYRVPMEFQLMRVEEEERVALKLSQMLEVVVSGRLDSKLAPKTPYTRRQWQYKKAVLSSINELQNIVRAPPPPR